MRVALPATTLIDGLVPRIVEWLPSEETGHAARRILDEMRPQGALRASIRDLADQGGAYIIVSADGSTADSALTDRHAAASRTDPATALVMK